MPITFRKLQTFKEAEDKNLRKLDEMRVKSETCKAALSGLSGADDPPKLGQATKKKSKRTSNLSSKTEGEKDNLSPTVTDPPSL